jgi:catechol 2,3-dioxygenase-like lactoylglutathione lyase family enzyme
MDRLGLAYVALVSRDVPAASRLFGALLGLPREDVALGERRVPAFALGESAVLLFAPDDPFLGEGARPGVHHIAFAAADPRETARALGELRAAPAGDAPGGGEGFACDPARTAGVRVRLSRALGLGVGRSDAAERIDHVGIASADNRAALGVFCGPFGLTLESQQTDMEVLIAVESFTSDRYGVVYHTRPPVPAGGLRVAFVTAGDCELEFLQNFDPAQAGQVRRGAAGDTRQDQGAIARFVAARGPGLHHLAFKSPDIDRTLARLAEAGVPLIDRTGRPGSRRARIGFLHPDAAAGVLLHAVERA